MGMCESGVIVRVYVYIFFGPQAILVIPKNSVLTADFFPFEFPTNSLKFEIVSFSYIYPLASPFISQEVIFNPNLIFMENQHISLIFFLAPTISRRIPDFDPRLHQGSRAPTKGSNARRRRRWPWRWLFSWGLWRLYGYYMVIRLLLYCCG